MRKFTWHQRTSRTQKLPGVKTLIFWKLSFHRRSHPVQQEFLKGGLCPMVPARGSAGDLRDSQFLSRCKTSPWNGTSGYPEVPFQGDVLHLDRNCESRRSPAEPRAGTMGHRPPFRNSCCTGCDRLWNDNFQKINVLTPGSFCVLEVRWCQVNFRKSYQMLKR